MSRREKFKVKILAHEDALDELAVDMRTDPADVLESIIDAALKDGALFARAILNVRRRARKLEAVS